MRLAARRRKNLALCWPMPLPICARWKLRGSISTKRAAAIFFRLAADQDQFLTMAKFRSLRKLWARIEEACGLTPRPALVCAETAWRMMTKRDPHGNIVRGTIAALAAAVGGADAITVLPFSAALGVPDGFARRIARNTQTILIEESNLHRVADPAAGSGAIEALTDALCQTAWWFFQRIERAGGAAAALEAGLIQHVVARVRAERETNVARRKEAIVGTSDFPDLHEGKVEVLAETSRPASAAPVASALPRIRLAEPFEHLRDRSDTYLAKHGARPKVFLACLGRPADFNARASFAKSLFEAGGIEAMEGSDDNLRNDSWNQAPRSPVSAPPTRSMQVRRPMRLRLSPQQAPSTSTSPASHEPTAPHWKAPALETFLHQGCDTLSILNAAYDEIDRR